MGSSTRPSQRGKFDTSKISAPAPAAAVERTRLFEALDAAPRSSLVWLVAPAGSGKTTLASTYAHARRLPVVWYRLDWRDEDLATFFLYFEEAVFRAVGRRGRPFAAFAPEYRDGASAYAANYFRHLWRLTHAPLLVVLDNCERLAGDHPLHELLAAGIRAAPPTVRWLFASRTSAPGAYDGAPLQVFGWRDLRFAADESADFVALFGVDDRARAARIHAAADGWAAAMAMQARLSTTGDSESASAFASLADQLLDSIGPGDAALMCSLAVLPSFDERAVAALHPEHSGSLGRLIGTQPLIELLGGKPARYRYHPLLREHLLARARRSMSFAEYCALLVAAARWLDLEDLYEDSAELFIEATEWSELRALLGRRRAKLLEAHREATLRRWLQALPAELVETDPKLQYSFGLALADEPAMALGYLESAFEGFFAARDSAGALQCFSVAVTCVWSAFDDLTPLTAWLVRRERIRRELPRCLDLEVRANATAAGIIALSICSPGDPRLRHLARFAEYALRLLPIKRLHVLIGGPLVHYYVYSAQNARLFALADRLAPALEDDTAPPVPRIHMQLMVAMARCVRGDVSGIRGLERCLEIARDTGVHTLDNSARACIVMWHLNDGALDEAERMIEPLRGGVLANRRFDLAFVHYLTAWLAAIRGESSVALEHARRHRLLAAEIGDVFGANLARSLLVQLYAERGDFAAAEHELEFLRASTLPGTQGVIQHQHWLCETWLALKKGAAAEALEHLGTLFRFAAQQQMLRYHLWRPDVATELCALAFRHGIEPEYATRLVRDHDLPPPDLELEAWPWPVKVYTLGHFAVIVDGKPVAFGGKGQMRPLELLKVIVALGGDDLPEERVAEALWPDADGDSAAAAFDTTLKRLRALLGRADAVTLAARRVRLNRHVCWVDAWAFGREVQRPADEGALSQAVARYRGAFLSAEDASWAVAPREHLLTSFLQTVRILGDRLESRQALHEAIEVYRTAITAEDCAEELYLRLMLCQERAGLSHEALGTFSRCEKILKARLGIAPSARVRDVHERLRIERR